MTDGLPSSVDVLPRYRKSGSSGRHGNRRLRKSWLFVPACDSYAVRNAHFSSVFMTMWISVTSLWCCSVQARTRS